MTQNMPENPFAGTNDAALSESTPSLTTGRYLIEITACSYNPTFYGDAYFAKFKILESTNEKDHPKDSERKWKASAAPRDKDSFKRNVKAFCLAACGISVSDPAQADQRRQIEAQSEVLLKRSTTNLGAGENIFKGRKLWADVSPEKVSKNNFKYNVVTFSPAPQ